MVNLVYWTSIFFLRAFYWDGTFFGKEKLPRDEACIFVGNHLTTNGPIGICCSFPIELHAWVIADMVDPELAEDYLRVDFVEKSLHLRPPASKRVAHWLVKLTVPYLKGINGIPVYQDYEKFHTTVQMTVDRLKAGKHVLIFPEDSTTPEDPIYKMAAFSKSMVRVAEVFHEQTGKRVAFYPVCVHGSGQVRLGDPIRYSGLSAPSAERLRIKNYLEEAIKQMYRQSAGEVQIEMPLPEG